MVLVKRSLLKHMEENVYSCCYMKESCCLLNEMLDVQMIPPQWKERKEAVVCLDEVTSFTIISSFFFFWSQYGSAFRLL